jgi:syntaxin 5
MLKDRTGEFFHCVESISSREVTGRLLPNPLKSKSEFTKASALISKEITETLLKLQKLAALAKKKSLFQDKPVEINELIYIIKQDIAKINHQIGQLSDYWVKQADGNNIIGNTQIKEHSHNVISSLQSKLAKTSDTFKQVLKTRSDNLKQQNERKDEYSFDSSANNTQQKFNNVAAQYKPLIGNFEGGRDSPLYHPEQRPNRQQKEETVIDFGSSFMQQELVQQESQNNSYLEARDQTIAAIESTIAELGQVYSRFATVLAEQGELVQRIDDNTSNIQMNIEGAHSQLLKYYEGMSNNRGLMLKTFGVLMVFFLIFVLMT